MTDTRDEELEEAAKRWLYEFGPRAYGAVFIDNSLKDHTNIFKAGAHWGREDERKRILEMLRSDDQTFAAKNLLNSPEEWADWIETKLAELKRGSEG